MTAKVRFGLYFLISLFCLIALLVLTPGFFSTNFFADLGALYVFGSLLCFALAHAAVLSLRIKKPELERPFKLRFGIRVGKWELPVTALLGLLATSGIWLIVVITQPYSRWVGLVWMAIGLIVYAVYRRRAQLPLTRPPKRPGEGGL